MNTLQRHLIPAIFIVPFISLPAQAQEDELIYSERFVNTTGENIGFEAVGWRALSYDPDWADPEKPVDLSALDGQPSGTVGGISSGFGPEFCFCDDDKGFIFLWTAHNKITEWAIINEAVSIDRSQIEITRVSWFDRSGAPDEPFDHEVGFMVKIGGQWYVTTTTYDPHPEGHDDQFALVEHPFTTAGSDWRTITADPDLPWSLGDPLNGSLPSGNVEGVGLYAYHPTTSNSLRVDELEIYGKPVEGGSTWAGYEIVEQDGRQYVNTSDWMGWIDITSSPWVLSVSLDGWMYLDEDEASKEAGAWMYIMR